LLLRHHHRTVHPIQNILLFAFSSHQIVTLFPKLYESGKDILLGNTEIYDVVADAANSVYESGKDILLGNSEIYDVVANAANSVLGTVTNATAETAGQIWS